MRSLRQTGILGDDLREAEIARLRIKARKGGGEGQAAWRKLATLMLAAGIGVSGSSPAAGAQSPQALNLMQRNAVIQNAVEMTQPIFSTTIAAPAAGNNVVTVNPRNVGLLKKFIVEISGTFTNAGGSTSLPTAYGLANLLSNVQFIDLNNFTRISTSGVHLAILKQVKHKTTDPASSPVTTAQSDAMIAGEFIASGSAPNFPVIAYPLPTTGANAPFRAVFEIPVAYSDNDLRGAIYANIINAQMQLVLTLNPNAGSAGTDTTLNAWGAPGGTISAVTITVYQNYLDQLPAGPQGVILPVLDLSTVYELKSSTFTGMVAGQEFPFPYTNFRDFLSTLAIFNSTGATAGLKNGSDVSYWALQSANFVNLFKIDPLLSAQFTRDIIGSDLPLGTYYFSHRKKPISTLQYGNMELILNPATATAGSCYATICWEDFGLVNTLTQAGSLSAG